MADNIGRSLDLLYDFADRCMREGCLRPLEWILATQPNDDASPEFLIGMLTVTLPVKIVGGKWRVWSRYHTPEQRAKAIEGFRKRYVMLEFQEVISTQSRNVVRRKRSPTP